MQQRPSSRLFVVNGCDEVLLFRFEPKIGPHAGQEFWATPGGGLEPGEGYREAARRELHEEVGLHLDDVGPEVAKPIARFALPSGEFVEADERYFLVRVDRHVVSCANWTQLEHEEISAHRWWGQAELRISSEQVWPECLEATLVTAGVWKEAL
jgi:8-oxo-dGTP pyrophosphatase MutT (NUDIX family)